MAYLSFAEVREAFQRAQLREAVRKSAELMLSEAAMRATASARYDVFLSHCLKDAVLIAGVKAWLEERGQTVYIDWVDDKQLIRANVTPANAAILRQQMRASDSMVFATSENSPNSKWMPWELGYFDGLRSGRIAILPLVAVAGAAFHGQEYLGLYPTIEALPTKDGTLGAFVTKGVGTRTFMNLSEFKAGVDEFRVF